MENRQSKSGVDNDIISSKQQDSLINQLNDVTAYQEPIYLVYHRILNGKHGEIRLREGSSPAYGQVEQNTKK